jgi:Xaa-Pro aminopeptidase/lysophospholipase L1-like esterase
MKPGKILVTAIIILCGAGTLFSQTVADPTTYLSGLRQEMKKSWPGNRTINIVFHGHSVPAGYFHTPDVRTLEAYPQQVLEKIKKEYPLAVVNVIVTAIGGENSESGAARFEKDVLVHQPDVLFIDYSLNDRGMGLERAGKAWGSMIERALEKNIKIILLTPTSDQRVDIIDKNSDLQKHADQIVKLAEKYQVGLVDSYRLFQEKMSAGGRLSDYMSQVNHPNRIGHALVADAIMEFFRDPSLKVRDIDRILSLRDRAPLVNTWLDWRLDNIIPDLLRREKMDMWIVMCREISEDPVYFTLVPEPELSARRLAILIFHDTGTPEGVIRLSAGSMGVGYRNIWTDRTKSQMDVLADYIKEHTPKRIGINVSNTNRSADGLTASLRDRLQAAIGPEFSKRLVSSENVAVGWIETRSPGELEMYRHICGVAHDLIYEFFSSAAVIPDVTTLEDMSWWIWQRMEEVGVEPWFEPYITIQRHPKMAEKYKDKPNVIHRGDLLHCDIGLKYMRLCTDMQWHAYVLNEGESDVPAGLQTALDNAVQLAEIYMGEFREGLSGHQIAANTMAKSEKAGLRTNLYSHPIGFFGHSAGTTIDTRPVRSAPEEMPKVMEYPLHLNTCYAIEFGVTTAVPEWEGKDVTISYEETAAFTKEGCRFIDGNQTKIIIIK